MNERRRPFRRGRGPRPSGPRANEPYGDTDPYRETMEPPVPDTENFDIPAPRNDANGAGSDEPPPYASPVETNPGAPPESSDQPAPQQDQQQQQQQNQRYPNQQNRSQQYGGHGRPQHDRGDNRNNGRRNQRNPRGRGRNNNRPQQQRDQGPRPSRPPRQRLRSLQLPRIHRWHLRRMPPHPALCPGPGTSIPRPPPWAAG